MATIQQRIQREPALVTGAVSALIALGVAFGLDLTGEQTGAIMAVTTAVLAFVTRAQVSPVIPSERVRVKHDPNKRA